MLIASRPVARERPIYSSSLSLMSDMETWSRPGDPVLANMGITPVF